MRFTVGISPQAGQDLEDIVFFITAREQDAEPAERFASALVDEAKKLADFPHRGKVFQRRPNVRRLVHGHYLISKGATCDLRRKVRPSSAVIGS